MTEKRKLQLETEVNTAGAREGLSELVDAARGVGTALQGAGEKGRDGLNKIGDGGQDASAKVERTTRSIINSIERTTAAAKAGEKGTAAYYEALATQRGADVGALRPYLDQLRAIEEAQKKATGGLDRMGMSAAQTANAMRSVPAQFTDIVVSLQSGQAPMTVLLQQGGQLKDMFGGTVQAVQAIGSYIAGMINPMTVLAAGGVALAYAFQAGSAEARAFQATTILTGQVAGVTSGQLVDMSASLAQFGRTQGRAAEVLNLMASSGAIGAVNLKRFAAAALDLQQVGGPAVEETNKVFQDLAKAPLEASLKLNEQTGFLTRSVYEQIRALEEQGRTAEAAAVAQNAYADTINQRTPQLRENLGLIERAWLGIKGVVTGLGDDVLNIGRALGPEAQATALRNRIAATKAGNFDKSELPGLEAQLKTLKATAAANEKAAAAAAEQARQTKLAAEWNKEGLQYLSKAEQLQRAINKAVTEGVAAGKDSVEIVARIKAIREGMAEKKAEGAPGDPFADARAAAKDWASAYLAFGNAALDAEGKVGQLTKTQIELTKYLQSPGYLNMAEPARQLALEQAYAAISAEQLAAANKAAAAAQASYIAELDKSAAAAARQVQSLADEAQATALAAAKNISLAEAIQQVELARLQDKLAQEMSFGDEAAVAAIQREIDKRRELADLIAGKAARKASEDAATKAVGDWQRASERIEQSLTDALMRGFEGGKGFAQNMRDSVVNMFKTLVLRPVVSAIVNPIAGAITSSLGLSSVANAAAGGAGAGSGLLAGGALAGVSLSSVGSAIGAGFMSTLGGGTIAGGQAAGLLAGGAATGTGVAGMVGAALPWVGAAALAANALGLFRTTAYKGTSLRGTLGQGTINDFDVTRKSGTLFSGPTWRETDRGANDGSAGVQLAYEQMRATTAAMAEQLGLSSEAIRKHTQSLYIDGNGKTADQMQQLLAEALQKAGEDLAQFALKGSALGNLGKSGETASQTLSRLVGVQSFSADINKLGGVFSRVANSTIAAKESLIELAGGVEALGRNATGYVQNYYSRDEIAGGQAKEIQSVLAGIGIRQDISATDPRAQFRSLVEGSDVNTEDGRKRLAALLGVQGQFAGLADYLAETGKSLSSAAAGAPDVASLAPMLASGTAEQVKAVGQVKDAIDELTEVIKSHLGKGSSGSGGFLRSGGGEVTLAEP